MLLVERTINLNSIMRLTPNHNNNVNNSFLLSLTSKFKIINHRTISNNHSDLMNNLRTSLKDSMKSKDFLKRDTIKSLMGDLQNSQHLKIIPSSQKILKQAIQKRLEAIKLSESSNPPRVSISELNRSEISILNQFLDKPMITDDHLTQIVSDLVNQSDLVINDLKFMGVLIKQVKDIYGDDVDGKQISIVVKKVLDSKQSLNQNK